jgi:hypothetical protein
MIRKSEQGYIALTTVIILGVTLLVAVLGFGFIIFFNRESTTQAILKDDSYFAARACIEQALLNLTADSAYTGGENISVSSNQCTISSVAQDGENYLIITTATIERSTTTLELTVDGILDVVSFVER